MTVSVIGGAGFIGTSLCKLLAINQIKFEILDLRVSQAFPELTKLCDIRDKSQLKRCITGDIVVNLAAIHRDDVNKPSEYHETNVVGSSNIADVCVNKDINKIIFTSSVAVYGAVSSVTAETAPINPSSDYGHSKANAETVFFNWRRESETTRSLIIVRPTVVFGAGNRGNVYNLLKQIDSGFFFMIGSGTNKKSMAYVDNVAAFLLQCIKSNVNYGLFNYVDDPSFTMNELVSRAFIVLRGSPPLGIRIPKFLGLAIGYLANMLSTVGIKLPISPVRVRKFCAPSEFYSNKHMLDGFEAPFLLSDALDKTIELEFLSADTK